MHSVSLSLICPTPSHCPLSPDTQQAQMYYCQQVSAHTHRMQEEARRQGRGGAAAVQLPTCHDHETTLEKQQWQETSAVSSPAPNVTHTGGSGTEIAASAAVAPLMTPGDASSSTHEVARQTPRSISSPAETPSKVESIPPGKPTAPTPISASIAGTSARQKSPSPSLMCAASRLGFGS